MTTDLRFQICNSSLQITLWVKKMSIISMRFSQHMYQCMICLLQIICVGFFSFHLTFIFLLCYYLFPTFFYLGDTEFHIMKVQRIHVYILKIHKVSAQYKEYLILIFVLFYFYIHHGYIVAYFLITFHSIFYFSSIS